MRSPELTSQTSSQKPSEKIVNEAQFHVCFPRVEYHSVISTTMLSYYLIIQNCIKKNKDININCRYVFFQTRKLTHFADQINFVSYHKRFTEIMQTSYNKIYSSISVSKYFNRSLHLTLMFIFPTKNYNYY